MDKRLHAFRASLQKEKEEKEAKRKEEDKKRTDEYNEKVKKWKEQLREEALKNQVCFGLRLNVFVLYLLSFGFWFYPFRSN